MKLIFVKSFYDLRNFYTLVVEYMEKHLLDNFLRHRVKLDFLKTFAYNRRSLCLLPIFHAHFQLN